MNCPIALPLSSRNRPRRRRWVIGRSVAQNVSELLMSVEGLLSEKRDMKEAKCFFKQATDVVGYAPKRVTTDGHDSYPRAIREILGSEVLHRTNRYLNNRLEQDHRGIKQHYYSMRGFGSVASASRFCRAFDEVRQFFRIRTTMKQKVSLWQQREVFRQRLAVLKVMVLMA